jgi:hypothetical protein
MALQSLRQQQLGKLALKHLSLLTDACSIPKTRFLTTHFPRILPEPSSFSMQGLAWFGDASS